METHFCSCHCGLVQFEFEAQIDNVRECNCSICSVRGTLNFRVPTDSFRLISSPSNLSQYKWGSRTATDYFCNNCGVMPFRKPSYPTKREIANGMVPFTGWAVNLRCVKGIDLSSLPVVHIDGAAL
ncbi:GFA family protein [Vibrio sp. CB1-14]|uniref:GFA family protein n=1 Tax=Vibrio chaetopteri TaxID=3016528 RepID=A0AAU8BDU3_9VIBR